MASHWPLTTRHFRLANPTLLMRCGFAVRRKLLYLRHLHLAVHSIAHGQSAASIRSDAYVLLMDHHQTTTLLHVIDVLGPPASRQVGQMRRDDIVPGCIQFKTIRGHLAERLREIVRDESPLYWREYPPGLTTPFRAEFAHHCNVEVIVEVDVPHLEPPEEQFGTG
jgi:hypothetical protein